MPPAPGSRPARQRRGVSVDILYANEFEAPSLLGWERHHVPLVSVAQADFAAMAMQLRWPTHPNDFLELPSPLLCEALPSALVEPSVTSEATACDHSAGRKSACPGRNLHTRA